MKVQARNVQSGDTLKIDGARALVMFVRPSNNGMVLFNLELETGEQESRAYRAGFYLNRV